MFVSARGVRIRIIAAAVACGAGSVLALLAKQTPSERQPTFRAGIDVVQVDVSVLDQNRRPVRNLTATDRATPLHAHRPRDGIPAGVQEAGTPPQPVDVRFRIVDNGDCELMNVVAPLAADLFAGNRGADYRVDLPIEPLGAGEYLFVIEAAHGQHTARRGVRFTVQ